MRVSAFLLCATSVLGIAGGNGGDTAATAPFSAATSILPQFAFGGGWYSALYFTNLTATAVSFPVNFVSDVGTPLPCPRLADPPSQVNLPAFGSAIVEAPNTGTLLEGYAAFSLPTGVSGYGVFRQSLPGKQDQEAVVPLSEAGATSNTLTWDETDLYHRRSRGQPNRRHAENVAVTLWDENGNSIGTSSIALPPYNKTAITLRALPGSAEWWDNGARRNLRCPPGAWPFWGCVLTGWRLPPSPRSPARATPIARASVLPQFAFGGGWYSALYFTNLTGTAVSFPVSFVADAGTALTIPALGGSSTQVNLAAHGTAIVEAPNLGDLFQGYAKFTLPAGVFGYGVFRQSLPGKQDQEAVVPLSEAGATVNTLTWDETKLITAFSAVNPTSATVTVAVTLWDQSGNTIGSSTIPLPPNSKTAAALSSLTGLSGMAGKRGSAQFKVTAGNVAVLGLRFNGLAFTSVPTSPASGSLIAQRELAQTGMAIGLASTVLQSQFLVFDQLLAGNGCAPQPGGGSARLTGSSSVTVYYDNQCTRPYVVATTQVAGELALSETATYDGTDGTVIGTMTLNETAVLGDSSVNLYGLGVFTPASGARTPVQLGVYCVLNATGGNGQCAGAIAQDFPNLGMAIGAVTPLSVSVSIGNPQAGPATFTGGGTAVTGPLGSLQLTNPSPTSLVIHGGTDYATTTVTGGAGAFELFPPVPTTWTLTDASHDEVYQIALTDNTSRNLTMTVKQVSTGLTLAAGTIDQSGSGTITYSDGSTSAITNWTLAD